MLEHIDEAKPVYRQIYDGIRDRVLSGRLVGGDRLPSSRALSDDLGVSRTTVLSAYNQLIAEGYLDARLRSGTFVSLSIPDRVARAAPNSASARTSSRWPGPVSSRAQQLLAAPMPPPHEPEQRYGIDFRHGEPQRADFPTRRWASLIHEWTRRASHRYSPPEGITELRTSICAYLDRVRGVQCDPSQVVVTAGTQHALYVISRTIADEGDRAVVEEPHYQGVRQAIAAAGLEPVPVPVDRQGLRTAELPPTADRITLLFTSPSHQFPLGGVLPLDRRFELLQWASKAGATIVEDDYDSEYRYEGRPVATLKSLDRQNRVLYVGTFSKTLSPWVRLGFIVAPEELTESLRRFLWATHRFPNPAAQRALAQLLDEGRFERNLRLVRRRNLERRDRLLETTERWLGDRMELWGTKTGGHAVGWLPELEADSIEKLVARAAARNLGLSSLRPHYFSPPDRQGLIFSYTGLTPDQIARGIRQLAELLGPRT